MSEGRGVGRNDPVDLLHGSYSNSLTSLEEEGVIGGAMGLGGGSCCNWQVVARD